MHFTLGLKKLPFEQVEKQAIYVESENNEKVNRYILKNYDCICAHFAEQGWEFVYLPKLVEELKDAEIVRYNAPYATGIKDDVHFGSDFLLQFMLHPENKAGFPPSLVYYNPAKFNRNYSDASIQYRGIELSDESGYNKTKNLSNILMDIREDTDYILYRSDDDWRGVDDNEAFSHPTMACEESVSFSLADDAFESDILILMDEAKTIVEKLRKRGVSEFMLQSIIRGEEKLSRLHITKDYRIILQDYGMEIEMKPLPKILFLLYLNHPEGIYFKDLSDHRKELMEYYKGIKDGLFSMSEAENRIERLTTPGDNSVNEKSSNIKAAFVSKIEPRLASNYCIVGSRAGKRKITLPRELVTWDK